MGSSNSFQSQFREKYICRQKTSNVAGQVFSYHQVYVHVETCNYIRVYKLIIHNNNIQSYLSYRKQINHRNLLALNGYHMQQKACSSHYIIICYQYVKQNLTEQLTLRQKQMKYYLQKQIVILAKQMLDCIMKLRKNGIKCIIFKDFIWIQNNGTIKINPDCRIFGKQYFENNSWIYKILQFQRENDDIRTLGITLVQLCSLQEEQKHRICLFPNYSLFMRQIIRDCLQAKLLPQQLYNKIQNYLNSFKNINKGYVSPNRSNINPLKIIPYNNNQRDYNCFSIPKYNKNATNFYFFHPIQLNKITKPEFYNLKINKQNLPLKRRLIWNDICKKPMQTIFEEESVRSSVSQNSENVNPMSKFSDKKETQLQRQLNMQKKQAYQKTGRQSYSPILLLSKKKK